MIPQYQVWSLTLLACGRICYGDMVGRISIFNLSTRKCELSWQGHFSIVNSVVCIDASRICSGGSEIKVWSSTTGLLERTLEGHTSQVTSMVLMRDDGRLCSASMDDGTFKLWNIETGECEKIMSTDRQAKMNRRNNVTQLMDGRLVSCTDFHVCIWS